MIQTIAHDGLAALGAPPPGHSEHPPLSEVVDLLDMGEICDDTRVVLLIDFRGTTGGSTTRYVFNGLPGVDMSRASGNERWLVDFPASLVRAFHTDYENYLGHEIRGNIQGMGVFEIRYGTGTCHDGGSGGGDSGGSGDSGDSDSITTGSGASLSDKEKTALVVGGSVLGVLALTLIVTS